MKFSRKELRKKAKDTFILILYGLEEAKLVESVCQAYKEFCNSEDGKQLGIKERELADEDYKRLFFEFLCFSSHIVMGRAIHAYIDEEDKIYREGGFSKDYFNEQYYGYLEEYIDKNSYTNINEFIYREFSPKLSYRYGDYLDLTKRLKTYLKAGSFKEEFDNFTWHVALALDPLNYSITSIIAAKNAKIVVEVVDITLRAIFEKS